MLPHTVVSSFARSRGVALGRFACLFVLLAAAPAFAEKRVALVIGNGAYQHAPALANPRNDAEAMAAALKGLAFEVLLGTDLDKAGMERLLQRFAERLEKADLALVFYAGHGLMVNGANYLVPIDGKLERESDLLFQAIPADTIQRLLEQAQRVNIIILDACRDNPLARSLARSMGTRSGAVGHGLAPMTAGVGMLIVYATAPGHQALDGEGKNSPFTTALLKHIGTPKAEIRDVLTRVRQEVFEATRNRPQPQIPWDTSSLMASIYLASTPEAVPPAPGVTSPTPPPSADNETLFWQSIKDSKNAADFKAYLARYPQGTFAELARIRLAEIEKAAVTPPPAPDPPKPPAPQRSSTSEPGLQISGTSLAELAEIGSTAACQSQCLRRANCVACEYTTAEWPGPARRSCKLFSAVAQRGSTALKGIVSGVIRTTPAPEHPAPKAVPPVVGGRTSTFEPGIYVSGGSHLPGGDAASPEACRAACLGKVECTAWYHRTNPIMCFMIRGGPISRTKSDFEPSARFVSGVIRTTQAAAEAERRAAAPVPPDRAGQMRELMRRAEANENENGFCARLGWGPHPWRLATNATPPSGLVASATASDCTVTRYEHFQHAKFGACVRTPYWRCNRNGPCSAADVRKIFTCRGADGYWVMQSDFQ